MLSVTPTDAGAITIEASDGSLSQTTHLTAAANNPSLKLLSAPNATAYVNEAGGVLKVQLLQADGVTPMAHVPVLFTAPAATLWSVCGLNVCPIDTDNNGQAASSLRTSVAGAIQLQAAYGGLTVNATSVVEVRSPRLTLISSPLGAVPVGTATASPFIAQLVDGHLVPMAGQQVTYGGVQGTVKMDCGLGNCIGITDANGELGSVATPLRAGTILLNATWLGLNVATSFTAVGSTETLKPVLTPPPLVYVGDKLTFRYQLLGASGLPLGHRGVFFSVPVGTLAFDGCPFGTCGPERMTTAWPLRRLLRG